MLPKVDGLLRTSLKRQPVLKRTLSRVVKHLVEVLLELRILNLIEDTPDLTARLVSHVFASDSELLLQFLELFLLLLQFHELIGELILCILNLSLRIVSGIGELIALHIVLTLRFGKLLPDVFRSLLWCGLRLLWRLGLRVLRVLLISALCISCCGIVS